MKTLRTIVALCGVSLAFILLLRAQGPLTPPGPPVPMMKSLDQIEPRRIFNDTNTPGDATAQHSISQPGSYYLTGNLAGESGRHGIRVCASDVTLDLNGFALPGAPDSRGQGIVVEAGGTLPHFALHCNLMVANGNTVEPIVTPGTMRPLPTRSPTSFIETLSSPPDPDLKP